MSSPGGPLYYVYCVAARGLPPRWDVPGVGDPPAAVFTLEHGDLAVVASEVGEPIVDPSRANAMAHERVLAAAMADHTIIPFALGHVLHQEALSRLLDATHSECTHLLQFFTGRVEVGLRVLWKPDAYLADIETPKLRAISRSLAGRSGQQFQPLQAQYGALVQEATEARRAHYVSRIYEPLAKAAVAAKLGNTLAPRMVINAAFLIDKNREAEFDALMGAAAAPYLERMNFSYTGPWPPHHFVTLHIQVRKGDGSGAGPG